MLKRTCLCPNQEAVRQGYHAYYALEILPIRAKIVIEHSQSMALLMATPAMIIIHRVTWTVASFCWAPSLFGLGTFAQLRSPSSVLTLPSSKGRVCDGMA